MSVQRLMDVMTPMLKEAVEKASMGEDVIWDVALTPTPSGTFLPALSLMTRGTIVGTIVNVATLLSPGNPFDIQQDKVDEAVMAAMQQLFQARSDQANAQPPQAPLPQGPSMSLNGHRGT